MNAPADALDKETLGFSDGEWNALVTSAPLDVAWIRFLSSDHSQMDVVDFLRFAAIGRDALGELQATKTAGGFAIERVKLSNDIQSDEEVLRGLSDALLDRIGRFLRLARKSGYTLPN